ncbi:MAG: radical SAM protein [Clostridiaceae bacterium]|nr:radical SAM protein [Clostridiaceae bacterium]
MRFKKVYIEITNVCNLSCSFCPGTTRDPAFMSAEDFERVLYSLEGHTRYIYLHVMGEPLLHPDLSRLLDISHSHGFKVNITTNGTLISERQNALLDACALRQVNFSLHSQEMVMGTQTLEKYTGGIFQFTRKALDRGDVFVSYRLWNIGSASAEHFNRYILGSIEKYFGLDYPLWDAFMQKNRITVRDRLFLNKSEVFEWPDDVRGGNDLQAGPAANTGGTEPAVKGFCLGLRNQIAILADGTVVPCCLDNNGTVSLGNIFTQELLHILGTERAGAIYNGFSQGRAVEGLCRHCSYRERFSKKRGEVM